MWLLLSGLSPRVLPRREPTPAVKSWHILHVHAVDDEGVAGTTGTFQVFMPSEYSTENPIIDHLPAAACIILGPWTSFLRLLYDALI